MSSTREIAQGIVGQFYINEDGYFVADPERIADAIDAALRRYEQEVRAADATIARAAKLPRGFQWGHDAMEQFDFGRERAALAIEKASRRDDTPQEG
jgi:hypothetical protein